MFERARYTVDQIDPEIFAAVQQENQRQEDHTGWLILFYPHRGHR
jgi:hypothetical protein